jgi:catechol 2,3-dioxygenase-like lactoylglutathione lyase family enzyme
VLYHKEPQYMISGVNHITLAIRDVEQSFAFYRDVLCFRPLAKWPKGAYFLAGDLWLALQLDPQTRQRELPEYTHIAFSVAPDHFETMSQRIRESGAKIWQENWTEGASLYFVDPNGHKLEIHASDLETRIRTAQENPWEGLEFFD